MGRLPRAPRALSWAFAASLALGGVVGGAPTDLTAGAASTRPRPAVGRSTARVPTVTLDTVSPAIASPGTTLTVRLRIRNTTSAPATPTVDLRIGDRLETRADIAEHLATPRPTRTLATTTGTPIAPGRAGLVTVTVPADRLSLPRPYGVLPATLSVSGVGATTELPTFVPYQVIKEYQPLRLAVSLPVTADPDPAVLSSDADLRETGWTTMLDPGSRLDRVVATARATGAGLIVDPSLVTDPTPARRTDRSTGPTATATTGSAASGTTPDPRDTFRRRVADSGSPVWLTPTGDPDLSALAETGVMPRIPEAPTRLPGVTGRTTRVGWPAAATDSRVRDAVGATLPTDTLLMPESRADTEPDHTSSASRRDPAGHRVLVIDDRLSAHLTDVARIGPAAATQLALADSLALVDESPGRNRTALVVPDRGFSPTPGAVAQVIRTLSSAPWITRISPDALLDADVDPEPISDPEHPATAPASPVTAPELTRIEETARLAEGLRKAVGSDLIPPDITPTLTSTRWRGHFPQWTEAHTDIRTELDTLAGGVQVVPSTINFFADKGALQITVVNNLDTEVHDVHLTTDVSGRSPRLRLQNTDHPLTIRPHSRTTVRVDAEAVAAGLVPVTAALRTADGTRFGDDATVTVRVRPTNGWILLAGGGVVGGIFLLGLFRAIRAGERRVAAADLRGLDLD